MIALYDFIPTYCPFCGKKILVRWTGEQLQNWYAHLTHTCPCRVQSQHVKTHHLVAAGGQEGNLPMFRPEVKGEVEKFNPMGYKHLCVICLKIPVENAHEVCGDCHKRLDNNSLSQPEVSRLYAELDYRQEIQDESS